MPQVGLERTMPVLERAKTFHTLDCATIMIGYETVSEMKISRGKESLRENLSQNFIHQNPH
jgi:hypothetical protein